MTANLTRFNRIIVILGVLSTFAPFIFAQSGDLSESQKLWIADKIFANECNRDYECLTSWNNGEDFPSLGIGHFIWYRADQHSIFTESFPDLLQFYLQQGHSVPAWLLALPNGDSPFASREQFYEEYDNQELATLREFLAATMAVQVEFIIQRQRNSLDKLLANTPASQRAQLTELYYAVANASPPHGVFALIDYVNFKGEGVALSERYQGQGWGLLQVLTIMLDDDTSVDILHRFSNAATEALVRRIENSPPEKDEQRWLRGWRARVDRYIPSP